MEGEMSKSMRKTLFLLSCTSVTLGACGGPLLMRLYFVQGGSRLWLSSFLQTAGWPIMLIPLLVLYLQRRKTNGPNTKFITMKFPVFIYTTLIGILTGAINYLNASGVQRLPVSTATLILSTQLVFTAIFALILVRQKFTPYTVNTVVLLLLGAVVLALGTNGDRPQGESSKMYALGFVMTFVAAVMSGLLFPSIELVYKKARQAVTCALVLEMQMVLCVAATLFSTVGMLAANDFKMIPREARAFKLGEAKYYVIVISSAIVWPFNVLGVAGIIYSASSLVTGIICAVLLPIQQVLAVVVFHDKFQAQKGLSLVLCLWGFASHLYGEYRAGKKAAKSDVKESDMTTDAIPGSPRPLTHPMEV